MKRCAAEGVGRVGVGTRRQEERCAFGEVVEGGVMQGCYGCGGAGGDVGAVEEEEGDDCCCELSAAVGGCL